MNRWNSLDQETVDVGSINSFKGRLDKIKKNKDGFFLWILHGLQSPRPHGDGTPVRPHKVGYKVSYIVCKFGDIWSSNPGVYAGRRRTPGQSSVVFVLL